jgi:hypothetical protein
LNKLVKIEELLNKLLAKIAEVISAIVKKVTPKKVSDSLKKGNDKLTSKTTDFKARFKNAKDSCMGKVGVGLEKLNATKTSIQTKVSSTKEKVKGIDWKSLTVLGVLAYFGAFFRPLAAKISSWYSSIKPAHLAGFIGGGTLTVLVSLNIYQSAKKIADKANAAESKHREPASVKKKENNVLLSRPNYYKKNERELRFKNIKMPVYVGNKEGFHYLVIDFTFISSNRYIKAYFEKKPYLIEDKLNSSVHPILPKFPLKEEGKIIVTNKVHKELNKLLKEQKIEGSIDEIYINKILAD